MHVGLTLNNSFCNQLTKASSEAVNWVTKYTKTAANGSIEVLKKVAVVAKDLLSQLGVYLGKGYDFLKIQTSAGFQAVKAYTAKNPQAVVIGAGAFAAGSIMTALFSRCCGSTSVEAEEAEDEANPADVAAPDANLAAAAAQQLLEGQQEAAPDA